jgi:hypothetical protein
MLDASTNVTTYPDREPYHYPFGLVANVCEALGATVGRVPGPPNPQGESVFVIERTH